jgi:hypothetical protein
MGVKYINIMSKTFTIFRMSSYRMYKIDRVKPMPAVKNDKQIPTMKTSGIVQASGCPEIKQTIDKGINPIRKLTKPASAVEIGNI